ncbi:MAG: adenine phosphoribosyltransferase, partial [Bacteroidetes bacterium]|nr:adenine phosphoribosyltransferase [Bacteroidota bacterium]
PIKGILFHDVTTLFKNPEALQYVAQKFYDYYKDQNVDYVAGVEARGFIVGSILAQMLNCGFILVRKPGKLPAQTISETYQLEYGEDRLEIHADSVKKGDRVVVIDDLIATGGTFLAAIKLIEKLEAEVISCATIIDMPDLGGSASLKDYDFYSLVEYSGH